MKTVISSTWLKPLIIFLIISQLFGCYTWKEVHKPVEEIIAENPKDLKILKSDSKEMMIHNPIIKQDSLKGDSLLYTFRHAPYKMGTTSIPINEIDKIYLNEFNPLGILIFGSVIVAWIIISAINFEPVGLNTGN